MRVVDVDEASLDRLGQWPWPRTRMAALVHRLRELGASAVAFDVIFAEPDRSSPSAVLRELGDSPALRRALATLPDHDQALAEAVAKGRVVTAFAFTDEPPGGPAPALKARYVLAGADPRPFLAAHAGAATTLAAVEAAAAGNGAVSQSFASDRDAVIRHVPLLYRGGERLFPSLAAEAVRVARQASNYVVESSATGIAAVRVGALAIDTDARGEIWLHYAPPATERHLPAWRVLAGDVPRAAFQGRIVFVGSSAKAVQDLRVTPLGAMPGVEIHAQAAEQMLDGSYVRRPEWARAAEALLVALVAGALLLLLLRLRALWSAAAGMLALASAALASWHAFVTAGLLLDPVTPALASAAVFVAVSVLRRLRAEQRARWIRRAFSSYVSPNRVRQLVEHPERLSLGAEWRECSFVLTDVAGFTALVERFDPERVVALLNDYLDAMIAIALRHEGTLDRVVGDGVAVMFSAPAPQPDHATRALLCALEMDAFAHAFAATQRSAGIAFGETRIGVHTGRVLVGNFGGRTMLDYRALGDPINTAARLESANRHLGTRVCVSAETAARCPGFTGRPAGALVLQGKQQPVDVFEPVADGVAPADGGYAEAFALMQAGDPRARVAFSALVTQDPQDALAAFHLRRLERGETGATVHLAAK